VIAEQHADTAEAVAAKQALVGAQLALDRATVAPPPP
jgi:hypothetical protein